MDAAIWGFVGVLAGAIVGALASIFTTFISSWNADRLQKNSDIMDRLERSRVFQRETLLDLQVALQNSMRYMGRAHYEDVLAARKSGVWGKSPLSEEVNQNMLSTNIRLSILTERVSDDPLRNNLKIFHEKISKCTLASTEIEADKLMADTVTSFNDFMSQLGSVLRSHY